MFRTLFAVLGVFCVFFHGIVLAQGPGDTHDDILELGEVVVTATKTPHALKEVPVDTIVITQKDIERTNAQTVLDVLRQVPGIATSVHDDIFGTYTWRATMRGLSFNDGYGLVLVDGQRMTGSGQSGGMGEYGIGLNQIPVNMIKRIEIVKGPGSALYGSDAMAGVINIITKGPSRKPSGSAGGSYGWYKVRSRYKNGKVTVPSDHGEYRHLATGYASFGDTPFDHLGYFLSYDYEKAQDIRKDPIDSYRHTGLVKLKFDPSDRFEAELSSLLSHYEKTGYREEDSWRIDLKTTMHPVDGHTLYLNGYLYDWDFEHGYPGYPYGYKHGDQAERQAEIRYGFFLWQSHHLMAGGEYRGQALDYVIENKGDRIPVDEDIHTWSVYFQDEYAVTDWIMAVPGVRYDHHSLFGGEVNPKFSIMLQVDHQTTFRASVGRAFKSPTIRQLYYQAPYEHGSYFIMSNPDLDPEKSWGYSMSIERLAFSNKVVTSLAFFRNDIDDLVQRVDTGQTYHDKPLLTYKNVSSARVQGIEFSARAAFDWGLGCRMSYTYTDGWNKDDDKRLTYVPEHAIGVMVSYDNRELGTGMSVTLNYTGRQYVDAANTRTITDNAVVGAKIYKDLAKIARLSLEADNLFGSSKGDRENFRTAHTYVLKLDMKF